MRRFAPLVIVARTVIAVAILVAASLAPVVHAEPPITGPQTELEPPQSHDCNPAIDVGPTGRDPADAIGLRARGTTCRIARQVAAAWGQGYPGPDEDGLVFAGPWRCRDAGARVRCTRASSAVSFSLGQARIRNTRTVRCADVSIDDPGPAGEASATRIRATNLSCRSATRVARYTLCHDGRAPAGWKAIGTIRGIADRGARNGRWLIRWVLAGGTNGSGC